MPRARFSTGWGIRRDRKAQRGTGAGGSGSPLGPLANRLALHLQSDFGVTTVSGKVSEWAGQEGYRNTVVQATDANRPTLVPNVLDGHPAIRFNGTQWLQALAQVGVVAGDRPRMYVVGSYATALASFTQALASYDNTTVPNRGFYLSHNALVANWLAFRGGAFYTAQSTSAAGNNSVPALFDGRNDAASVTLAISGVDTNTTAAAASGLAFTPDIISIGEIANGAQLLTGDIFCVIVVNNETATSHATIMNYLAGQYPSLGLGTPKGILGPLLHADFDAADPGIVLNAGNVASIPNRGTDTAALIQVTAGKQPAYSATSFAGGPGMTFDGVDDTMACTFASAIPAGRRPYMWVVFKANNLTASDQIAAVMEGGGGARFMAAWSNRVLAGASFAAVAVPSAAGTNVTALGLTETTNTHLMEVADTVGGVAAYCMDGVVANGTPGAAFVVTDTPMSVARLVSYQGTSQFSGCTIRRVIVANDLPSQAQIDAMRAYLRAQPYGLTF